MAISGKGSIIDFRAIMIHANAIPFWQYFQTIFL